MVLKGCTSFATGAADAICVVQAAAKHTTANNQTRPLMISGSVSALFAHHLLKLSTRSTGATIERDRSGRIFALDRGVADDEWARLLTGLRDSCRHCKGAIIIEVHRCKSASAIAAIFSAIRHSSTISEDGERGQRLHPARTYAVVRMHASCQFVKLMRQQAASPRYKALFLITAESKERTCFSRHPVLLLSIEVLDEHEGIQSFVSTINTVFDTMQKKLDWNDKSG